MQFSASARQKRDRRCFILKITGIIIVFMASALTGSYFSHIYSERCRLLRAIIRMYDRTALMIRYSALPVEDIISGLAADRTLKRLSFLCRVDEDMKSGGDFRGIWQDRLSEWDRDIPYREESELLSQFGSDLGASDAEGQLDCLRAQRKLAEEYIAEAEKDSRTKGKLCRSMGVLIGLGAALILL